MAEERLLEVEIISPQSKIYEGKAIAVMLPGAQSPFEVLYNHAPIVSSLDIGLVRITDENMNKMWFASSGGFAEISKNKVSILVENAKNANELDKEQIHTNIDKLLDSRNRVESDAEKILIDKQLLEEKNYLNAIDKI